MKTAVHFGAGNIGRGFIGVLLHRAGYEVVFADVVSKLVDELNEAKAYRVITLDERVQTETVNHVRAVRLDSTECKQELVDAALITTAVGLPNLPSVAGIIADGLKMRFERNPADQVNIMACENAIRATSTLKRHILEYLSPEVRTWIESHVGFADVAVDRIAPNREGYATQPLDAVVERFFEWDIEEPSLKGGLSIEGATFVQQLNPYLERKLFILNGAHATAAYAGYQKKYGTILEAMRDSWIEQLVRDVQREAITGIVHQYPALQREQLEAYAQSVRERFLNPHIKDDVQRVGRDPLRKLSSDDRLVRPLMMARKATDETPGLVAAIALGLSYSNDEDPAAVQVQTDIQELGIEKAVARITGLEDEQIIQEIVTVYTNLKQGV